ncbi:hypothetical protein ACOMHN_053614 [Nucella lapillus]
MPVCAPPCLSAPRLHSQPHVCKVSTTDTVTGTACPSPLAPDPFIRPRHDSAITAAQYWMTGGSLPTLSLWLHSAPSRHQGFSVLAGGSFPLCLSGFIQRHHATRGSQYWMTGGSLPTLSLSGFIRRHHAAWGSQYWMTGGLASHSLFLWFYEFLQYATMATGVRSDPLCSFIRHHQATRGTD